MTKPVYALSEDEMHMFCDKYEPMCSDECPLRDKVTRNCLYFDTTNPNREKEVEV